MLWGKIVMEESIGLIVRDSVGLGVLILVLVGLYRIIGRVLTMAELGFSRFLNDFERVADGIADIAEGTNRD